MPPLLLVNPSDHNRHRGFLTCDPLGTPSEIVKDASTSGKPFDTTSQQNGDTRLAARRVRRGKTSRAMVATLLGTFFFRRSNLFAGSAHSCWLGQVRGFLMLRKIFLYGRLSSIQ